MSTRALYLIIFRAAAGQRSHFAIWAPYKDNGDEGTLIHVVGAPMAGFMLEFKRVYNPSETRRHIEKVPIGFIHSQHVFQWGGAKGEDSSPQGTLEIIASSVPAPRASQNFLAPVNDTTNRRCQEWTMDYVRMLVQRRIIAEGAINIVHSKRDAPEVGIGLRPRAAQQQTIAQGTQQQGTAQGAKQQAATVASSWVWDDAEKKYRYWNGSVWVWQTQ